MKILVLAVAAASMVGCHKELQTHRSGGIRACLNFPAEAIAPLFLRLFFTRTEEQWGSIVTRDEGGMNQKEQARARAGNFKQALTVDIEKGNEWLHDFPLFWGFKIKNPPQIAIWVEDTAGNYLSTIYVSRRTATGKWHGGRGIERPEALPAWLHAHRAALEAAPVDDAIPDAVSGATPRGSFSATMRTENLASHTEAPLHRFVVKIELNHSRDWNDAWPAGATGKKYSAESGQPAVVYAAHIDLDSGKQQFEAVLVGHSSPDGSDGDLRADISTLTSALDIVKKITIII